MGRDPGTLFYGADAAMDVSHMNRLERGCYFDILQTQIKFGKMSLDLITKVLGKDFDSCWGSIKICLTYENDMYYINWLNDSINQRRAYSESRKSNRLSKICATYVNHMVEVEEEEEERVRKGVRVKVKGGTGGRKKIEFVPPSVEDVVEFFRDKGYQESVARQAFEYYHTANWKDSRGKPVLNWKQKMIAVWMKEENKILDAGNGMLSKAGQRSMKNAEIAFRDLKQKEQK